MKDKFSPLKNSLALWSCQITGLSWQIPFVHQDEFGTNIFKDLRMFGTWL